MFGRWQGGVFEDHSSKPGYSTAPQTAPSAQPEEQQTVRWELPSLADTQGSHTVIPSTTCTQACGDVLRIDTKTQLESDFPQSCSCSSLCHSTGCCQCRFFFWKLWARQEVWPELQLCFPFLTQGFKRKFLLYQAVRLIYPQTQSAECFETGIFFLLGTWQLVPPPSHPSFLQGKDQRRKKSYQICKDFVLDQGLWDEQATAIQIPVVELSNLYSSQTDSKSERKGLGNVGKSHLAAPDI